MLPKGTDSMIVSGLHFGNALVGSEWATAVLLCINGLRKQSSYPVRHPFLVGSIYLSLAEQLPDEFRDYFQLVKGGCGLSHEHVEDGCKSTCVEFGGLKPNRTGYMASLIRV